MRILTGLVVVAAAAMLSACETARPPPPPPELALPSAEGLPPDPAMARVRRMYCRPKPWCHWRE